MGWQHQVPYSSVRSEAGSFQPLRAVTSQTLLTFRVVVLNSDDSALGCSGTFKYCLLIQGLYSEGINHTDVDLFCINKWKLFATMNCNMQDNGNGTGNGCDFLDHYENCPHELPGTCNLWLIYHRSQPTLIFICILSSCTLWNSDIHLFTDMMEEVWMCDSRLPGAPISKTHLTGFPQGRENPVTRKSSLFRLAIVIFSPDLYFYLYCQAKYNFHLILWCVGILNSLFTAGCHLSGVPLWAAQPYQGTLMAPNPDLPCPHKAGPDGSLKLHTNGNCL